MITAAILFGYALTLATLGTRLLAGARWVERAPRLGIAAWQALSGSILLAVLLGALVLAVPTAGMSVGLAELLEACALAIHGRYGGAQPAALAPLGLILAAAIVLWTAGWVLAQLTSAHLTRRRHRWLLAILGRYDTERDLILVEHPEPAAYCLAGRPHRVVLTSATLRSLDEAQLAAVIAHERAHLRERHHLVVALAAALCRAFPRVRAFADARKAITELVEMLADDAAARSGGRLAFAEAVLTMADRPAPSGALAAGGGTTATRVRRLIAGRPRLGRLTGALGLAGALTLLLLPGAIAVTPAATAGQGCCATTDARTVRTTADGGNGLVCPPERHGRVCARDTS